MGTTRNWTKLHERELEHRIIDRLERAGHRLTEPRTLLVRAVSGRKYTPFTGEDLYEQLRETGLGRATVFRTLRVLQDIGVLTRLHTTDGCRRYIVGPPDDDHDADHHDRLICRECGHVAYLDECPMQDALSRIARQSGYKVETHQLDIVGLCADCTASEPMSPLSQQE